MPSLPFALLSASTVLFSSTLASLHLKRYDRTRGYMQQAVPQKDEAVQKAAPGTMYIDLVFVSLTYEAREGIRGNPFRSKERDSHLIEIHCRIDLIYAAHSVICHTRTVENTCRLHEPQSLSIYNMRYSPVLQRTEITVTDNTSSKKTAQWDIKKTFTIDTWRGKSTHHKNSSIESEPRKSWRPPALRPIILILMILVSVALLVTLQLFLIRSNRDQGVIFATSINELPLSRTFIYRYFPTIVAVVYSIFWAWIDLETKRVEPWYRLSREGGSSGKDSLLLTYPFDFAPFVPFRAFKRRHWPVFWASLALVLVTFGLVPVQAGIFTVKRVTRETATMFNVNTSFVPADRQPYGPNLKYHSSAYGIASLNETLPPYMAINYTLAPFSRANVSTPEIDEITGEWTAPTTLYSVGLACEQTTLEPDTFGTFNSSWGCTFTVGLDGNKTRKTNGLGLWSQVKKYSALYAAAYKDTPASYYLDYCPPDRMHTIYAAFQKNKEKEEDPPNNVTAIFCEPKYYAQDVNATVDSKTQRPKRTIPLGPQRELSEEIFNKTMFEKLIATGTPLYQYRGDILPSRDLPKYITQVAETDLSSSQNGDEVIELAITLDKSPLESYLDWMTWGNSLANAYRLLFARTMTDILASGTPKFKQVEGKTVVMVEAVVLQPVFTYIVEGLLAAVSLSALVLLYLSLTRSTGLISDPSTTASIMSLVAESQTLIANFRDLDCCSKDEMVQSVREKSYKLVEDVHGIRIVDESASIDNDTQARQQTGFSKEIKKPVRPTYFKLWMAVLFVGMFVIIAVGLGVVFAQASSNGLIVLGLSLPSRNKIVQNILENYIPTATVMVIEPMWILINRYLCLLQPFEELRKGNAKAKVSIDVKYSTLPPQLVIWKSLRAHHVVLTAVCAMALLSNLLAVAFAGLFYHKTTEVRILKSFQPPFEATFVSINGTIGPSNRRNFVFNESSGAYRGEEGQDQFLIAESNYTGGTPLPAWTDDRLFYVPFKSSLAPNSTATHVEGRSQYEAETTAFGAELKCSVLDQGSYGLSNITAPQGYQHFWVTLSNSDTKVNCINTEPFRVDSSPVKETESELVDCQAGPSAAELVFNMAPVAGINASQIDNDICRSTAILGWLRTSDNSCDISPEEIADRKRSFFVQCKPQLVRGRGTVRVDESGRLQRPVYDRAIERDLSFDEVKANFSNDPINLISQSNRYLFYSWSNPWHNDTVASDFFNYFIRRISNSTRLLDPKTNLPTLEEVQAPLNKTYSTLFAIWLGANQQKLLLKANGSSATAWQIEREERLFLSTPLFGISLGILSAYAVVAIVVYFRRPGQFLPRLPTSIASTIGLFAASTAVHDMRGTSRYGAKERGQHLKALDTRYGYGDYVGVDGNIHVGIEKAPFVRPRHSWGPKTST
ncbi:hypothetical protein DM02DRAFT_728559 [Periconia macrospinosa]|uniref:Uncharacterized protein n=1 Tax=Periconia macrospinosa TaxID=97972 RepID=A0A2V1DQK4_9PLEO|nr:hypothetical protein DM02DRAFT_728559 [Periconia macrospinosa]